LADGYGPSQAGATVPQAQANIAAIASHLEQEYPQTNERMGVAVYSALQSPFSLKQDMRPALAILMAAVWSRAADRLCQCCEPAVGARYVAA